MTITKVGEDSIVISFSDQSNPSFLTAEEFDSAKINAVVRSALFIMDLSWPDFETQIFSNGLKSLIFAVYRKRKPRNIFAFRQIDDILDVSALVPDLCDSFLYLLDGIYYLIADTSKEYQSILLEFSSFDPRKISESYIIEHGEQILAHFSMTQLSCHIAEKSNR